MFIDLEYCSHQNNFSFLPVDISISHLKCFTCTCCIRILFLCIFSHSLWCRWTRTCQASTRTSRRCRSRWPTCSCRTRRTGVRSCRSTKTSSKVPDPCKRRTSRRRRLLFKVLNLFLCLQADAWASGVATDTSRSWSGRRSEAVVCRQPPTDNHSLPPSLTLPTRSRREYRHQMLSPNARNTVTYMYIRLAFIPVETTTRFWTRDSEDSRWSDGSVHHYVFAAKCSFLIGCSDETLLTDQQSILRASFLVTLFRPQCWILFALPFISTKNRFSFLFKNRFVVSIIFKNSVLQILLFSVLPSTSFVHLRPNPVLYFCFNVCEDPVLLRVYVLELKVLKSSLNAQ